MKEKLKHFLDWYIVYYLRDVPAGIYKTVRHWWRCNGQNPYHWHLAWYAFFHHYGWDHSFFDWKLLQISIKKSRYYFERHRYISHEHLRRIAMWQEIAISLTEIILEERKLWDMHWTDNELKYKCLVNVNMKNMNRFPVSGVDYETGRIISSINMYRDSHELYKEKARQLLLKILDRYATEWWD